MGPTTRGPDRPDCPGQRVLPGSPRRPPRSPEHVDHGAVPPRVVQPLQVPERLDLLNDIVHEQDVRLEYTDTRVDACRPAPLVG
eukprot:6150628-Alexandrium_andersonii.AAC.1